jgi:hypothetical protein
VTRKWQEYVPLVFARGARDCHGGSVKAEGFGDGLLRLHGTITGSSQPGGALDDATILA